MSTKPVTAVAVAAFEAPDGTLHRTKGLATQHALFSAMCDEMTKFATSTNAGYHSDRWAVFIRELCHPNNALPFRITFKEPCDAPPQAN